MDQIFQRRTEAIKEVENIKAGERRGRVYNFELTFKRCFPGTT